MPHRDLDPKDFVGKTIKKVDFRAVNVIRFFFTDGTAIAIETENHAMIACDVCVDLPSKKGREDVTRSQDHGSSAKGPARKSKTRRTHLGKEPPRKAASRGQATSRTAGQSRG